MPWAMALSGSVKMCVPCSVGIKGDDAACPLQSRVMAIIYMEFKRGMKRETVRTQDSSVTWLILTAGCCIAQASLTFQFPPHTRNAAFTVVIGPIIALMKEQVGSFA
eukprot:1152609-Pelagomonas_calceolata.AAC.1